MGKPDDRSERLQKLLSRAGVASRRAAEELIAEGRVTVNGVAATVGQRVDPETDAIKVDGRRIQPSAICRYILVNKPTGVISTVHDPEGRPTVLELLPDGMRRGLVPVGRLDFDSEGLLLLTDDGDLAHHVAHPRYGCHKTYEVKVKGRPSAEALAKLRGGIVLDGRRTAPARVEAHQSKAGGGRESISNSWWRVVLGEGRTRQIREMFFRVGHPVNRLRRVAIGTLRDEGLRPGSWRELSEQEVEALRQQTRKVKPKPKREPASKGIRKGPGVAKLVEGGKGPGGAKSAEGGKGPVRAKSAEGGKRPSRAKSAEGGKKGPGGGKGRSKRPSTSPGAGPRRGGRSGGPAGGRDSGGKRSSPGGSKGRRGGR